MFLCPETTSTVPFAVLLLNCPPQVSLQTCSTSPHQHTYHMVCTQKGEDKVKLFRPFLCYLSSQTPGALPRQELWLHSCP